eukprot:7914222-Alexandrium_andersonii.AAC.1
MGEPPVGESESNGVAERAVQEVQGAGADTGCIRGDSGEDGRRQSHSAMDCQARRRPDLKVQERNGRKDSVRQDQGA